MYPLKPQLAIFNDLYNLKYGSLSMCGNVKIMKILSLKHYDINLVIIRTSLDVSGECKLQVDRWKTVDVYLGWEANR